jgi:uncharacterized protein YwqG
MDKKENSMDTTSVQAAFVAAGLSRVTKDILWIVRSSIRILATPVEDSTLPLGASKIGGTPDLPPDVTWPQWKNLPQSFIAQIRLDDVPVADEEKLLPQHGMLWFFYDSQQETYGANAADRGGWRVLFNENIANLQRTPAPDTLAPTSRFGACSLRFSREITLSQQPELDIPNFDWTTNEQQKYEQVYASFPSPEEHTASPRHRLLGYPDTLQDDMRLQCELVTHGITDTGANNARVAELEKSANEWRLLLQIDTDERIAMRWASSGMLYYWMKQDDLLAHNFDTTWLVLQSE